MKQYAIAENDANQRLDRFLKKLLPNATLSLIYRLIRTKKVRLNGKKSEIGAKLQTGDTIDLFLGDTEIGELGRNVTTKETHKDALKPTLDPKSIILEDADILAINKPAGINVHPGDHKTQELSLIQLVHDYLGNKKTASLTFRPSLVHRLDRDTSGVILVAKSKFALDALTADFRHRKVEKQYLAVVAGIPTRRAGTIKAALVRRDVRDGSAKAVLDEAEGQNAVTHYRVLGSDPTGTYALVVCRIETGRTHQIRAHMASIGHPVLGDRTYGDTKANAAAKRTAGTDRQLLHSTLISFMHPRKQIPVCIRAKLPPDFSAILGNEWNDTWRTLEPAWGIKPIPQQNHTHINA